MKEEVKAEWVRRLRSGDYLQTREMLVERSTEGEYGYCCLGVLTDMAIEAGVPGLRYSEDRRDIFYRIDEESGDEQITQELPYPVYSWAGIKYGEGDVETPRGCLIDMNDHLGYSFEEIADVIEECL